jgi:hypothetical protein
MLLLQWLTFVSATLAAGFQARRSVQGWLYARRARVDAARIRMLGWSQTGVDTWIVQAEEPAALASPAERTATVTLRVCDRNGRPSADQADRLRRYLNEHDYLSRNPTPDELHALERFRQEARELDSGELTAFAS